MKIDIRLKQLLENADLDERGVTQEIAKALGVHRHTIGKLYRNQLTHPSLSVLEGLCEWLADNGVKEPLPQALFGIRPEEFWGALGAFGKVTIYIGEYRSVVPEEEPAKRWIAVRDAEALADLVRKITSSPDTGDLQLETTYVPCEHAEDHPPSNFEDNIRQAKDIFRRIRKKGNASILIGSQRVNPLLETLVADLFRARAFTPLTQRQSPKVPFYLVYHTGSRVVRSCFGGTEFLPGSKSKVKHGVYYRDKNDRWVSFPWKRQKQDAGIVITVFDPGSTSLDVAIFGYSGWATGVMGKLLCSDADQFWPEEVESSGRKVGVFICRFKNKNPADAAPFASSHLKDVEYTVESMNEKILKKYLR